MHMVRNAAYNAMMKLKTISATFFCKTKSGLMVEMAHQCECLPLAKQDKASARGPSQNERR